MHVNCAGFVYKAMGDLIQVLYRSVLTLLRIVHPTLMERQLQQIYTLLFPFANPDQQFLLYVG